MASVFTEEKEREERIEMELKYELSEALEDTAMKKRKLMELMDDLNAHQAKLSGRPPVPRASANRGSASANNSNDQPRETITLREAEDESEDQRNDFLLSGEEYGGHSESEEEGEEDYEEDEEEEEGEMEIENGEDEEEASDEEEIEEVPEIAKPKKKAAKSSTPIRTKAQAKPKQATPVRRSARNSTKK